MKLHHIELGMEIEAKGKTPSLFQQVHGTKILEFPNSVTPTPEADGAFTFKSDLELYVFSADCMPVLFFGEDKADPIAAVHSGWRGTKDGILQKAVSTLAIVEELHVWIGPHIKSCCFEVKEDFLAEFKKAGRNPQPYLRNWKFDLLRFALETDLNLIPKKNRHLDEAICTMCSSPSLPSYRKQGNTDPRIRSWIKKL